MPPASVQPDILETKTVKQFRGIALDIPSTSIPLDYATDLLNVMFGPAGHIEKLRIPRKLGTIGTPRDAPAQGGAAGGAVGGLPSGGPVGGDFPPGGGGGSSGDASPPPSQSGIVIGTIRLSTLQHTNTAITAEFIQDSPFPFSNALGDSNVSKEDPHDLAPVQYVWTHSVQWFRDNNSHVKDLAGLGIKTGYDDLTQAQCDKHIADMASRHINGMSFDYYGPDTDSETTLNHIRISAEATPGFEYAICIDKGAIDPTKPDGKPRGGTAQGNLLKVLQHIKSHYSSPAYAKRRVGGVNRPVIMEFGLEHFVIDWAQVKTDRSNNGNPLLIQQYYGGISDPNGVSLNPFTSSNWDGAFAWISANASDGNIGSPAHIRSFYTLAKAHPDKIVWGPAYKGFDDRIAPWTKGEFMPQQDGETWLQTFSIIGEFYSQSNKLHGVQIDTWDDIQEGTPIVMGIDSETQVTNIQISSGILSWDIDGNDHAFAYFRLMASGDDISEPDPRLSEIVRIPVHLGNTHYSLDLTTFALAPNTGNQVTIYLQAVGKASIVNALSNPAYYEAGPSVVPGVGPTYFTDYQTADGTRQVVAVRGGVIMKLQWPNLTPDTILDTGPNGLGPWEMKEANDLLYLMSRTGGAYRWDGSKLDDWGIAAPYPPPILSVNSAGSGISQQQRVSVVVTWSDDTAGESHEGPASTPSTVTGVVATPRYTTTIAASTNPRHMTANFYFTMDGGGDYFYYGSVGNPGSGTITLIITSLASLLAALDQSRRVSFISLPPPLGKYLVVHEGRFLILNLLDDPHAGVWSGFELIEVPGASPQESFPPNNRMELKTGADDIRGGGSTPAGVLIFSKSNEAFSLRGTLEDFSFTRPVNFSEQLKQLNWGIGMASHYTGQSTTQGFIWWASDHSIQITDGESPPVELSHNISPLLRRSTIGAEENARAELFSYLERDWYALCIPIDGATYPNYIIVLDASNAADPDNKGLTIWGVAAEDIGVVEDPDGKKRLLISRDGEILEIKALSEAIQGATDDLYKTNTSDELEAFWDGGYLGNDSPFTIKMFRGGKIVCDASDARDAGYKITAKVVDDETNDIMHPKIMQLPLDGERGNRFGVNWTARRCGLRIDFPKQDKTANVQELSLGYIPVAERH
jgi:hypothetical protein